MNRRASLKDIPLGRVLFVFVLKFVVIIFYEGNFHSIIIGF